jgi:hypothetical protein
VRALRAGPPWCSLHAECVIEDPSFASWLAGQWLGLIEGGLVPAF